MFVLKQDFVACHLYSKLTELSYILCIFVSACILMNCSGVLYSTVFSDQHDHSDIK